MRKHPGERWHGRGSVVVLEDRDEQQRDAGVDEQLVDEHERLGFDKRLVGEQLFRRDGGGPLREALHDGGGLLSGR